MTRKEDLEAHIQALEVERVKAMDRLSEIKAAEAYQRNIDRIGLCFKYRNSYSCPQDEADYWYIYAKIIGVDVKSANPVVARFEVDIRGRIEIRQEIWTYEGAGWSMINAAEYDAKLAALHDMIKQVFESSR